MKKQRPIWAILLLLTSSCFNLRDPETPKPETVSEWTSPTQPEILIGNFSNAVRSLNVSVYDRCFTSSFRFLPDPATQGASTFLFQNWSVPEERDYFNGLKNKSAGNARNVLELTKTRENFFTPDSLEQFYKYKLQTSQTDTALQSHNFTGQMRLILTRRNTEWKIARWEDSRENQTCWSDLKKYCIAR
ncbi:hypothetical protein [Adhaeribacter soli]|uniref:Nuclear transport factor 2 family protein n=1 Tax=Adhaeribacter soli TaxID=2607655 RepID=A0A5N1J6D7_9BACT|nr:hypothetical protein [Adhaeribacter soli]KAA9340757.1 hypothetical protein F0P94_04840 [Adhaeribacter soli]